MVEGTFSDHINIGAYFALLLPSVRRSLHIPRCAILWNPICVWPRLANNDVDGPVSSSPLAPV